MLSKPLVKESIRACTKQQYIYLNNAIVGCSSIKFSLWQKAYDEGLVDVKANSSTVHGQGFWDSQYDISNSGDLYTFSFVRNPYSRILSCYLDKFVNPNLHISKKFCATYGLQNKSEITFLDFLENIVDTDPFNDGQHWRPQYINVLLGAIRIDFLGNIEHFIDDLGHVFCKLGIEEPSMSDSTKNSAADHNKVAQYYTDKEIELVKHKYEQDFELFGYSQDINNLNPLKRGLSFDVTDISSNYLIRAIGTEINDQEMAKEYLNSAIMENPANTALHAYLLSMFMESKDDISAQIIVDKYGSTDIHHSLNFQISQYLVRNKDYDSALSYIDAALESGSSIPGYYMLKANILVEFSKLDEARDCILKAAYLLVSPVNVYLRGLNIFKGIDDNISMEFARLIIKTAPDHATTAYEQASHFLKKLEMTNSQLLVKATQQKDNDFKREEELTVSELLVLNHMESLGDNCEFGFVGRSFGHEQSSLFRWAITPISPLIDMLNSQTKNIYQFDDLVSFSKGMVKDLKSGFSFHSKMKSESKGNDLCFIESVEDRKVIHKSEFEKVGYQTNKFYTQLKSDRHVIYVVKCNTGLSDEKIRELDFSIRKIKGENNYTLFCVQSPDHTNQRPGCVQRVSDTIVVGCIDQFSPYTSANAISKIVWHSLIKELSKDESIVGKLKQYQVAA